MNKKLTVILSVFLLLFILSCAVYLIIGNAKAKQFLEQAKIEENNSFSSETEHPPQKSLLTKEMILNGTFAIDPDNIWPLPELNEGMPLKFINGKLDEASDPFTYAPYTKIDSDHMAFGDLNEDGSQDAVIEMNIQYSATDETYGVSQILYVVSLKDNKLVILAATLLPQGTTSIDSIYLESELIKVELTRQTGVGLPWHPLKLALQYKLDEDKLIQPKVAKTDADISFISPKAGDVWELGTPHRITFNKPFPYGFDCANNIYLVPEKTSMDNSHNITLSEAGKEVFLDAGIISFVWDTQTTQDAYCGISDFHAENYGWSREGSVKNIKPGTYKLSLYASDVNHGIGSDIIISSDYFTVQ